MNYFAYGSNMSLLRLKARVPSAQRLGSFYLHSHDLRFHKTGRDGSGKCDAHYTNDQTDIVWGSVFTFEPHEKVGLDHAEGLGFEYDEKIVNVIDENNNAIDALMYYAINLDKIQRPYSWYKDHVLIGAKESNLAEHYISKITATESIEDLDISRDAKERAIYKKMLII